MKDLPDLALLATTKSLDAKRLHEALTQTFTFRKTHSLPANVPDPPVPWATPYLAMVGEDQLQWCTPAEVTTAARAFLDPILIGGLDAT